MVTPPRPGSVERSTKPGTGDLVAQARRIVTDGYPIGPRLHPCLCGEGRHTHAGTKMGGANPSSGCTRYRRDKADALAEQAMESNRSKVLDDIVTWHTKEYPRPKPRAGGWGVGPSDTAGCRRRIQLRERPPADLTTNAVDESAATLGDIFHDVLTRARSSRFWWRKFEFVVSVPGLDRTGRVDEYDPLLGVVADYKTCGEYAWERLGIDGPKEVHWEQISVYSYGLACAGHDVSTMRVIYIRRSTGEDEVFDRPYDEMFAKASLAKLTSIMLALDLGIDLPRDGRGPSSDPICARFCAFRDYCWNVPAAAAAGRSPESYTILGEHPDLESIEWAAALARGWSDQKSDAVREYDASKVLLVGVADGTYGEFTVRERVRSMPEYKDYYSKVQAAEEAYGVADPDTRGDFIYWVREIRLKYRRDVYPEIKHVRYAEKSDLSTPKRKKSVTP